MAYALEPGFTPDAQNPRAQMYALYRLHQQAQLGQLTPEEVTAAAQDPTGWWRAYTAALGGVIPNRPQNAVGLPPQPQPGNQLLNPQLIAAAGHRYSPNIRRVTPRQAVMQRLTQRAAGRGPIL